MGGRKSNRSQSMASQSMASQARASQAPQADPMLEYLKQMQGQQDKQTAAAAEAQKQAILQSQINSSQQMEQQGEQQAAQQLATANSMQSIRDSNALLASQQSQSQAGQQATGGVFDVNASKQEALNNFGATTGILPTTQANLIGQNQLNPAASSLYKKTNTFSLPQSSDLNFGGA